MINGDGDVVKEIFADVYIYRFISAARRYFFIESIYGFRGGADYYY